MRNRAAVQNSPFVDPRQKLHQYNSVDPDDRHPGLMTDTKHARSTAERSLQYYHGSEKCFTTSWSAQLPLKNQRRVHMCRSPALLLCSLRYYVARRSRLGCRQEDATTVGSPSGSHPRQHRRRRRARGSPPHRVHGQGGRRSRLLSTANGRRRACVEAHEVRVRACLCIQGHVCLLLSLPSLSRQYAVIIFQ